MDKPDIAHILLLLFLAGTLWMLWPFIGAILLGILTAHILHFLELELYKKLENRILSHSIILILLVGFTAGIIYGITSSVSTVTSNLQGFIDTLSGSTGFIIELFNLPSAITDLVQSVIEEIGASVRGWVVNQFQKLPSLLINTFIYFVTAAYFFKEGSFLRTKLFTTIKDMDEPHRTTLRELTESINTLFTDVFLPRTLLSLLSLLLASVGLYLMGIQFWWGWALLIAAVAFLPLLAPFIVYLPLGIIYMAIGDFWLGVIIIIYGILVLDTLPFLYLSPYIKTHSPYHHPAILFISFVSGLLVFGVKGLILGPLAITLTLHFLYNTYTTISTPS